jgi:TPP-dependent pyruvate/acetoin dehydrogenase alpha subunit
MKTDWTPESLAAFEADIAATFNRGEIRAPVHLAGGNEAALIKIFQDVRPQDWVCIGWRGHYHCLLKRVPADELKAAIIAGSSITLCFPTYKIIASAMVGGIAPVALGLAWAAKRRGMDERVWLFLGDMAASTGIVHECALYARGHDLPMNFIVEDNGKSVSTDTAAAWGSGDYRLDLSDALEWYSYDLPHRHVGTGVFVNFPDIEHKSHGL